MLCCGLGRLRAYGDSGRLPRKVALVAAMRKLLTTLNAIAKSGKHWEESLHAS